MTGRVSADPASAVPLRDAAAAIASARRATLADRYAPDSFTVEWRRLLELEPIAAEWRALAARALEPNVFYEPAFALAAAAAFEREAGAVLVWSGETPRRLLGFFPARIETRRWGLKLPVLIALTHPYAPLGVPLVEHEAPEPVISAFVAHVAADPAMPGLLLLPYLPADGPFAAVLDAIMRRSQMQAADFNCHQRALLAPDGHRANYVGRAVGQHQQKELRRRWRRLSEQGAVLFSEAVGTADVDRALSDFLALEAGGWKGRAGTASADHEQLRSFVLRATGGLAAGGKVSIHRLLLDGRAIAAGIVLRSGRAAWFWKIAYDENYARYSPGVMLTVELTTALIEDAGIARTDSCATANHPMIDHLWRERLALCDRLLPLRPDAPFARARVLEGWRRAVRAGAKSVRGFIRAQLQHALRVAERRRALTAKELPRE